MSGRGSKLKGKAWERAVAQRFRDVLGLPGIGRGLQARGGGVEAADVEGVPGLHIECKHGRSVSWAAALRQAERDAAQRTGQPIPVAIIRDHGNADPSPFVVLGRRHLYAMLKAMSVQPFVQGVAAKGKRAPGLRNALLAAQNKAKAASPPGPAGYDLAVAIATDIEDGEHGRPCAIGLDHFLLVYVGAWSNEPDRFMTLEQETSR